MDLLTESHAAQAARWPTCGRHIMAQFDADSIVVYQAYRPSIGHFAVKHQHFGGDFSLARMNWIKPNFLWMMYRCGWATKDDQQVVLAITLARSLFDAILAAAVPSSYHAHRYASREAWAAAVQASDVRLQWDPDHDPGGQPLERRAIQLGLRGAVLASFARPRKIEDITPFVGAQREVLARDPAALMTPTEHVYPTSP